MSFLKDYVAKQKIEVKVRNAIRKERVASLAEDFYCLINDVARSKYDVNMPDDKQFALTSAEFMIWLDKGFRKAHKIGRK